VIARFCAKVLQWYSSTKELPFAICNAEGALFDKDTGALSLCDGVAGLNCSEFVRTLLRSQGVDLVDTTNWVVRQGDKDRQQEIIDLMEGAIKEDARLGIKRHTTPTREHVDACIRAKDQIRVRPEEIAAACLGYTYKNGPQSMCTCETAGLLIMAALKSYSGRQKAMQ
jgi:hypothetical protein